MDAPAAYDSVSIDEAQTGSREQGSCAEGVAYCNGTQTLEL